MKRSPSNAEIGELLSREADKASYITQRAFRRAARSAFLWPEEACDLIIQRRSLTELAHVGPFLEKKLRHWILRKMRAPSPPMLRQEFLTLSESRVRLDAVPKWRARLRGDLQMHTTWSDGSGSIRAMAEAALARSYKFIAITDHSQGLRIANGIDEQALAKQPRSAKSTVNSLRQT